MRAKTAKQAHLANGTLYLSNSTRPCTYFRYQVAYPFQLYFKKNYLWVCYFQRAMAKAVLIDDHRVFIEGLRNLLSEQAIFEEILVFTDADDFIKLLAPSAPRPEGEHIILLDINLGRVVNGVDICAELKKLRPEFKVIALSMHDEHRYVAGMMDAAADGYLLKSDSIETIVQGVRSVMLGNTFLSESVTKILERTRHEVELLNLLNPKEKRVLELALEGKSNKDIGMKMHLNHKTIAYYKNSIFLKYEVRNMKELSHLLRTYNE